MYNSIMVPVDVSHPEVAHRILEIAGGLVNEDGKITVVHVVGDIPAYAETYVPAEIRNTREREQRKALEDLMAKTDVDGQILIVTGTAHARILDMIEEMEPDLVIIGSHRPGISDYFLGSTAARVVRHAPCSVLVDR